MMSHVIDQGPLDQEGGHGDRHLEMHGAAPGSKMEIQVMTPSKSLTAFCLPLQPLSAAPYHEAAGSIE